MKQINPDAEYFLDYPGAGFIIGPTQRYDAMSLMEE